MHHGYSLLYKDCPDTTFTHSKMQTTFFNKENTVLLDDKMINSSSKIGMILNEECYCMGYIYSPFIESQYSALLFKPGD